MRIPEISQNESSPEGGGVWAASIADTSSVPVKYWNCYSSPEGGYRNTHQFDITDQRKTNGQVYMDLGALEGDPDDMLSVTMEVNTNPFNGMDHVPCAHIHFDGDNVAVSLFKIGNKILMRPETDVTVEPTRQQINTKGPLEPVHRLE